jgi:hypothetical protein
LGVVKRTLGKLQFSDISYKLAEADETIRFQEELELFDFIGDAIDMALR